ncbi:MAG: sulfurtransferase-like selenium metabolism protein YedF [Spirochaetaceae bacterium]|nr:sulfurtransferase-like selenium metabolism protein YedF [Spirochaetaceae bacterium]
MNKSPRIVDARGLPCPQPVVLARKALEGDAQDSTVQDTIEVLVDNETAKENVLRYAEYSGHKAQADYEENGSIRISISVSGESASMEASSKEALSAANSNAAPTQPSSSQSELPKSPPTQATCPTSLPGKTREQADSLTVFLATDKIGHGNDELGELLMKGFIYALAESEHKPDRIIFMNGGIKLAVEGSEFLENLRHLEKDGVEILACGTCLDFYGLKEKLAVGRVSNMYEIVNLLSSGRVLRP